MAIASPGATDHRRLWLATDQKERRVEQRASTSLVATLRMEAGDEAPVIVLDLSSRGALIETDAPPNLDVRYTISLRVYGDVYTTPLQVMRWTRRDDTYLWGCQLEIPADDALRLRRAVQAALGQSTVEIYSWQEIREAVLKPSRGDRIVVGRTPAGHLIELAAQDVNELGPEGLELYVRTVASLETM